MHSCQIDKQRLLFNMLHEQSRQTKPVTERISIKNDVHDLLHSSISLSIQQARPYNLTIIKHKLMIISNMHILMIHRKVKTAKALEEPKMQRL
jgi:hypothetical protein